jgi:hypothetical protein
MLGSISNQHSRRNRPMDLDGEIRADPEQAGNLAKPLSRGNDFWQKPENAKEV